MTTKILVIDDSLMVRKLVESVLRLPDYAVIEAANGVEALEKFDSTPELSLIICDVNMPGMNGLEVLESLRDRGCRVPIVMLTTEGQPELLQRARSLGAKGWLVKPFAPALLAATAKKLAQRSA